jgi:acetyltransferase-like isoleucine patch superfamily enzyme
MKSIGDQTMIAKSAKILPNVELGIGVVIEDFCIIGCRFHGYQNEKTVIGDYAVIRSHTVIYAGNLIGDQFSNRS